MRMNKITLLTYKYHFLIVSIFIIYYKEYVKQDRYIKSVRGFNGISKYSMAF